MFTEPYMGTIALFGGNFIPFGWAACDGSLMEISSNPALFNIIANAYGGDGVSTFALPNLQGRIAIGAGQGNGMAAYKIGQAGGQEAVTMSGEQVPGHTHDFINLSGAPLATNSAGGASDPTGNVPAVTNNINSYNTAGTASMAPSTITPSTSAAGGTATIPVVPPYQAMTYIICTQGIYPQQG